MKRIKSGKRKSNTTADSYRKRFARRWYAISSVLILLWSLWTLLDAFIIPRDIISASDIVTENASEEEISEEEISEEEISEDAADPAALSEADEEEEERIRLLTNPVITDTTYNNGDVSIEISYMRTLYTDVYVADITMRDPSYLGTALADGSFGRNLTDLTSNIAEQNGAILAINGDYYGFRDTGYVIRNGYLYRSVPAKDPQQ